MPVDQPVEEVKAEQGSLIKEKQELDTARIEREQLPGAQSNRPTIEPDDEDGNTAKARLRAFEDEHFGTEAVRINGQIEKGSGSPFAGMHEDDKLRYTALERLVVAEQKLEDATALAGQAEAERAQAEQHLADCEKELDRKAEERDRRQAKSAAARKDARPAGAETDPKAAKQEPDAK